MRIAMIGTGYVVSGIRPRSPLERGGIPIYELLLTEFGNAIERPDGSRAPGTVTLSNLGLS
jgi:hypothetical protein